MNDATVLPILAAVFGIAAVFVATARTFAIRRRNSKSPSLLLSRSQPDNKQTKEEYPGTCLRASDTFTIGQEEPATEDKFRRPEARR